MHPRDPRTRRRAGPWTIAALAVSSCCGLGYVPVAPGTAGSALALPLAWLLHRWSGPLGPVAAAAVMLAVGWGCARVAQRHHGEHDSRHIVVDELVGQLLSSAAVAGGGVGLVLSFGWFRLFDVLKPWPAGVIDRRLRSAWGVMLDDVAAAAWAAPASVASLAALQPLLP